MGAQRGGVSAQRCLRDSREAASFDGPADAMPVLEAVILAGGEDKRLHPLTAPDHPKCLLPVANAPVLQYAIRTLNSAGVKSVFVVRPSRTSCVRGGEGAHQS